MSKRNKGRYLERRTADLLKGAGWSVHLCSPKFFVDWSASKEGEKAPRVYSLPQDIFGADIIAKKKGHLDLFIQVTSDTHISRKIERFREYPYNDNLCRRLIFKWHKVGGRWRVECGLVMDNDFRWAPDILAEITGPAVMWGPDL